MNFSPLFSVASVTPPNGRPERRVNNELKDAILALVELRNRMIRTGDRNSLDATYDGLESRDYSIQREDHERTSYYDWYINHIERGLGAEVMAIHVVPVYDLASLPYKYNANWTINQPEFELQIETKKKQTSWYVRRDILQDGELRVILPNFCDAPWKAPILENRGGYVEFNAQAFAKELADHIGLEFCSWSVYLNGLVKIRAFALNVNPYEGMIQPCLLTDKETFDESEYGKWCLGDWRFYNFTSSPHSQWPYGDELCRLIHDYVSDKPHDCKHPKFEYWVQPREDFEVLLACAMAVQEPEFSRFLQRFDLADDFEIGVFHAHDERCECNFALDENQDLATLIKE
ncbi:hypothetical protein [Gimesia sp.]|uniref:hypothetical protein n=1 Tax=Gimesia sp. TaxID=2024833 RepID=UPI003A8F65FD